MQGNLRFEIDWGGGGGGGEGGAYIRRGDLTEGFFALRFWGAYIWRGLFLEFYGT